MSVYFVYRSHYATPNLNHLKKFHSANVLEWFRENWIGIQDFDEAESFSAQLLGAPVYGFSSFLQNIAKHKLRHPQNKEELKTLLTKYRFFQGDLFFQEHVIQISSNDGALDFSLYFFDDDYVSQHDDKVAFLWHPEWTLPAATEEIAFHCDVKTKELEPEGLEQGKVYCAFMSVYGSGEKFETLDAGWKINNLRLPGLPKYLGTKSPGLDKSCLTWPTELLLLRSQLLKEDEKETSEGKAARNSLLNNPENTGLWDTYCLLLKNKGSKEPGQQLLISALAECAKFPAASLKPSYDWTFSGNQNIGVDQKEMKAKLTQLLWRNDPHKSRVQCDSHVAQLSVHIERWSDGMDLYNRWILFDDLWAGANPALANAILRYVERWDVLT